MPNQSAIDAVLNLLQSQAYLPSVLIKKLMETGMGESDVKEAVAQLLHDQQLELTADRHLHLQVEVAAL